MVGGPRVLGGRYRLDEPLASGGMGTVYVATDERLGRRVAVKLLKDELAHDDRFVQRFRREARAAAALSHPNVASVFDYGEDSGTPFIVMELAPGRDLARVLREDGPLPAARARRIATQMCAALGHAHAAGLVHRDVKPANVIVDADDRVKVTDFGIARATGESTLTATGTVLGSAHYMSPEQASGAPVTPASDVYAAGLVLYEMLTNALPFTGESPVAVALRHVSDEVPRPSALNPDVPADLDDAVARATARDPAERWRSAGEMAAALTGEDRATVPLATDATQVIGPGGAAPATTVWPIPGDRYDPRRLGTGVLVAGAALVVVAAALWAWTLSRPDEPVRANERREASRDARATETPAPSSHAYALTDFRGWALKEAEKELGEHGLVAVVVEQASEEPEDEVIASEPGPGTALAPGETVTLIVSTGEEADEEAGESGEGDGPGRSEEAPGHAKKDKDGEED
jgi:hypothetical protein